MRPKQVLSIRQTVWLVMALTLASTVLGASALYSCQLYRAAQYAEQLRVLSIAEAYAAQVGPLWATDGPQYLSTFIGQLAWHPSSCLLVVLDAQDKPIAVRGQAPLLTRCLLLLGPEAARRDGGTWGLPADAAQSLPEMNVAAVPIPARGSAELAGTLLYAARLPETSQATRQQAWRFVANITAIAVVGILLGFGWMKKRVLDPLASLSRQSKDARRLAATEAPSATDRSDEIGELARALAELHLDLDEWRERAVHLERTVDSRVAAQTRKITRELKNVQQQTYTDPLTKLGNRRLLDEKFAEIFQAQQQAGHDLSIVMLDVDHFKTLNDTHGHKAGDELLTFLGELLKQGLREQDVAIRYGGDEFVLILPAVSAADARAVAERTIALFAQRAKLCPSRPQPSLSAGIASLWQHQPSSPQAILQMADEALYQAKRAGRARAVIGDVRPRQRLSRSR